MFDGLGANKKENADPRAKLLLRRYFLEKYHAPCRTGVSVAAGEPVVPAPAVFDACQAGGALWGQLRKEYRVRYWGVDLKPQRKGVLKIDSSRVLEQPGLPFDIIDIDTFCTPWRHWLVMLPHLRKAVTVFLTLGKAGGVNDVGNDALEWLGLQSIMRDVPPSLRWKLAEHAGTTLLAAPLAYGITIVEAQEATASRNARYVGVRLSAPHGNS